MNGAHYLLQVNIYLVVFYGFYRILLDKETYFTLNRIYLIAAGLFSLLIPFIHVDWFSAQPLSQNVSVRVSQLYTIAGIGDQQTTGLNWGNAIALLYVSGVLIFLLQFLVQLFSLRKAMQRLPEGSAFSFFNRMFVHPQLPGQDVIQQHEHTHMRQMHSLDILFFELLGIVTWFNPVIYFYKHSIRNIHEYLADEEAVRFQGDKTQYSMLLLSKAFDVDMNMLTNNFSGKPMLKKRIAMLHKEKSARRGILKYGLFLPLFALTLLISSATIRKNETIRLAAEGIPLDRPLNVVEEETFPAAQAKALDFVSVDTPPSFPGGIEKFYAFIGKNIKYPPQAVKKNVQGKVFLQFIVEEDGRLSNIKVDRSLSPEIDQEAKRVLELSPAWIPGTKDNQPVRVLYHIPVSFTLSGGSAAPSSKRKKVVILRKETTLTPEAKSGVTVRITETTAKKPAYIVDGRQADAQMIQKLDPNNIERIDVIKSTAGQRYEGLSNKDGLVIIKTKSAQIESAN
jgi:TonB family protein